MHSRGGKRLTRSSQSQQLNNSRASHCMHCPLPVTLRFLGVAEGMTSSSQAPYLKRDTVPKQLWLVKLW